MDDSKNYYKANLHSHTTKSDDGYIRFDVVDKYGKRANTCAYFI